MGGQREIVAVRSSDPIFCEVKRLRYRVLYEPFGIPEAFDWNDDDPNSVHLVAMERGDVIGYGRLEITGAAAQVRHLSVDPKWQRQGLGGELLGELIARARASGAKMVYLNARFTALGLYRGYGFVEVGPVFNAEHTHLPHKRMELILL